MLKVYDYSCGSCGHTFERFAESGTETVVAGCVRQCNTMCTFRRRPSAAHYPQNSMPNFVAKHTQRARVLGFDNSSEAKIGRYDNDDPKKYKSKIIVGGGK